MIQEIQRENYEIALNLNGKRLVPVKNIPALNSDLKVVSLFCGCGGMDLGFQGNFSVFGGNHKKFFGKNPFKIVWANDIYHEAIETYKLNIGNHALRLDISDVDLSEIPDCDIVLGGFPCQDFSISGKQQGLNTERGNLYKQMLRVVEAKRPAAFVAENVKNILNKNLIDLERNQPVIQSICDDFNSAGYKIKAANLYAPDYGIPQRRERVFIIGIREELDCEFFFPYSHHGTMSTFEAIDDLWGKEEDPTIPNHNQMSLAKFKPPRKNGNQGNYQVPKDGPSQVMRAEHHMNIQAHYRTYNEKNPEDRNCWRRLTVREAARLQTFPDSFEFVGQKSHGYRQLGNAVPPILGWYVARALAQTLARIGAKKTLNIEGASRKCNEIYVESFAE